jgi:hypothetical protein
VNLIMPKLGERAVTSLDTRHPTLAILLPVLDLTRRNLLIRGWWFNEYKYTAQPDVNGYIDIGTDTLSFIPDCAGAAVVRGQRLYNPDGNTDVFTSSVAGKVIADVPFNELPDSACVYILYSACVEAFATDIGTAQELQVWQMLAGQAWSSLMTEHLRQRRHSTRKSRHWQKYLYALRG